MNREDAKDAKKKLENLAFEVIGAAIEVHRELGPGYLETVYEEALTVEFGLRGIGFERQYAVGVQYKGVEVGQGRLDFFVDGVLVVELKAVEALLPIHTAHVLSYLRTTKSKLGILINFNSTVLKDGVKRVILSNP